MYPLLLLIALTGADPGKRDIYNARSLVDREWIATSEEPKGSYGSTQKVSTVLSLHEGADWSSGKAWMFRIPNVVGEPQAFKGFYTFYIDPDDEDNICLFLRMTRKYEASYESSGLVWKLANGWESTGVFIDLPIANATIPAHPSMTARDAVFVDSRGQPTRKYIRQSGLLNSLLKSPEEELPYRCDFFRIGATLRFSDERALSTLKAEFSTLPTGFTPHDR